MGSLQDVLFSKGIRLSFQQRITILKSIALGMNWLHNLKPPFLHRDLKSGNILVRMRSTSVDTDDWLSLHRSSLTTKQTTEHPSMCLALLQLDNSFNVKISDFGLSSVRTLDEDGQRLEGPGSLWPRASNAAV